MVDQKELMLMVDSIAQNQLMLDSMSDRMMVGQNQLMLDSMEFDRTTVMVFDRTQKAEAVAPTMVTARNEPTMVIAHE